MPRINLTDAEPYISIGVSVATNGNSRAAMEHSVVGGTVVSLETNIEGILLGFYIKGVRRACEADAPPGGLLGKSNAVSSWHVAIQGRISNGWIEVDTPVTGSIIEYKE